MRALLVFLAACTAASPDPGLGRALYVDGAQFRPGAFPDPTGGPATLSVQSTHESIVGGTNREPIHGALDATTTGVIIGIDGYSGAWIVPAGPPAFDTPGDASVDAVFALDKGFPPGPFTLLISAVDAAGKIGQPYGLPLLALPYEPPSGELVVGLVWEDRADLDIHVIDPLGNEVWRGNPNSTPPPAPGDPLDPCAWASGGILDRDANADCALGGTIEEDVVWTTHTLPMPCGTVQPIVPSGTYTVRVEAKSLCGDASSAWRVFVTYQGETLEPSAQGIATPYDADYGNHGRGAGTTAKTFVIQ